MGRPHEHLGERSDNVWPAAGAAAIVARLLIIGDCGYRGSRPGPAYPVERRWEGTTSQKFQQLVFPGRGPTGGPRAVTAGPPTGVVKIGVALAGAAGLK